MERRRVLALFGRGPRPGTVKTRLVPRLGANGAVRLYRAFLLDVVGSERSFVDETVLWIAPPLDERVFAGFFSPAPRIEEQQGNDLAARLEHAFAAEFARGATAVVLRNTDSPLLPAAREEEAFLALERGADLVFGPDLGGGYYLVGMRRPYEGLFHGVATSVPGNFEATLERARERGSVTVLAAEPDVDTPADLDRLIATLAADPAAAARAPATARAVQAAEGSA